MLTDLYIRVKVSLFQVAFEVEQKFRNFWTKKKVRKKNFQVLFLED